MIASYLDRFNDRIRFGSRGGGSGGGCVGQAAVQGAIWGGAGFAADGSLKSTAIGFGAGALGGYASCRGWGGR